MGSTLSIADLKEEKRGEVLILHIKGKLDALSSPSAEKKVSALINSGNIKILVDLAGVTHLSSAGMRMLLSTTKKIRTLSGRLSVCGTPSHILDILRMSGFDRVLELFKTEEEALRHF